MNKENVKTLGVFIGRMRPVHIAHIETIQTALNENSEVLVLVGSCFNPRTIKNPFTFEETQEMIRMHFTVEETSRLYIKPLMDHVYDNSKWIASVQSKVFSVAEKDEQVTIYGADKDHTSFYLKLFPQWNFRQMDVVDNLHATDIRKALFTNTLESIYESITPRLFNWLTDFRMSIECKGLIEEYNFAEKYKEEWKNTPHPVTFNTVDAIIECNGHILTITRDYLPQKGTWCIPGSFLPVNKTYEDAILDIIKDKTGIQVSRNLLKGSIIQSETYDFPYRSLRGRVITRAYYIKLNLDELPKLGANKLVQWVPLAIIAKSSETAFEDHLDIVCNLTGISKEH
jgi:bifunctional NMN adenylyltransferase/nudix hydrolase